MKLSAGVALGLVSMVGSMFGSYYTNLVVVNSKIADAKETLQANITASATLMSSTQTADEKDIASLKEAVGTIKSDVSDIKKGQLETLTYIRSR